MFLEHLDLDTSEERATFLVTLKDLFRQIEATAPFMGLTSSKLPLLLTRLFVRQRAEQIFKSLLLPRQPFGKIHQIQNTFLAMATATRTTLAMMKGKLR